MAAKLLLYSAILTLINFFALFYLKRKFKADIKSILKYFFLGGLGTLPFILLKYYEISLEQNFAFLGIAIYILFALFEEIDKSLFFAYGKKNHSLVLFISTGLGFAYVENLFYFYNAVFLSSFILIFFFRIILSTPAHALFTGTFGSILEARVFNHRKAFAYLSGILFAVFFHSIFNIFQHFNLSYLAVPLLVGNYYVLREMRKS